MRTLSLVSVLVLAFAWTGCSDDDDNNCNDNDGDGYGVGDDCTGPDCDDADPAVHTAMDGYPDGDGDGTFASASESVCTDGTLPSTHQATAGTDCDDDDEDVYQNLTGYMDADGDGEGAATAMEETICSGAALPTTHVADNTDCDDGDASAFELVTTYYPDMDGDTVFAASPMDYCNDGSMPDGWSATAGTDCDDGDPFWSNAATDQWGFCENKGQCLDIEMLHPAIQMPDGFGVGACINGLDCNDASPICNEPLVPVTPEDTCAVDTDCATDEYCLPKAGTTTLICYEAPACCNNNMANDALTCGELSNTSNTGCLQLCVLPDDPTTPEVMAYATCLSMCVADANPKAQYLFGELQKCLSAAGCFAPGVDKVSCATVNCATETVTCMSQQ